MKRLYSLPSSAGVLLSVAGAVGSVVLTLLAGRHNHSIILLLLFAMWVLAPFLALVYANTVSPRWSVLVRRMLFCATLVVTLGSLAIYANMLTAPPGSKIAVPFVVVPAASWILIATVLSAAALLARPLSRFWPVRLVIKSVAMFVTSVVVGITLFLGLLLFDHNRDTMLPTPTGSFTVGRTALVWHDDTHPDIMAPQPGASREVMVWIWYPAAPAVASQTADSYLPTSSRAAMEPPGLLALLSRDLSRVHAHSYCNAELSSQKRSYPVVLMRGGGAAPTIDYTSLNEDLASHGYVVVGFDAPYRSWVVVRPNGSIVRRSPQNDIDLVAGQQADELANKLAKAWCSDTRFVLDQLERLNASDPSGRFQGRLDFERVGMFGHSLGGSTALLFCHDDPRCKAGVDIDGAPLGAAIKDGLAQPFMFFLSDHSGETSDSETPEAIRHAGANIRSIYNRLPGDKRIEIVLQGANHYMFSDNALLKSPLLMSALHTLGIVRLDGRRQLAATAHCLSDFFDVFLQGSPAIELKKQADFPEIKTLP